MEMVIKKGKKVALVFGGSGLVGSFLIQKLLESPIYGKVVSIGRSGLGIKNAKLEEHQIDFEHLNQHSNLFQGDDLYCCLGTTIKKAGSKAAFRKVDFTFSFEIAKMASQNKVNQFLLVSAAGADMNSLFFYNEVKGELEEAIQVLTFWGTHIFRPSILLGDREESRPLEKLAIQAGRIMDQILGDKLEQYQPVEAEDVAKAMVKAAQQLEGGLNIYPSHQIKKMADGSQKLLEGE